MHCAAILVCAVGRQAEEDGEPGWWPSVSASCFCEAPPLLQVGTAGPFPPLLQVGTVLASVCLLLQYLRCLQLVR